MLAIRSSSGVAEGSEKVNPSVGRFLPPAPTSRFLLRNPSVGAEKAKWAVCQLVSKLTSAGRKSRSLRFAVVEDTLVLHETRRGDA